MTISEKQSVDYDELLHKMDDLTAELELQSNYLITIKWLLITMVVMLIPVCLFIGYIIYQFMYPVFCC